jgi:hypothetical protein
MVNGEWPAERGGGDAYHIEAVKTGIVICFLTATIIGLVSAKPSPGVLSSKPLSVAKVAPN